ncbi:MAG TPA: hypothetical protein VLH84_02625 [Patescibacteria group bacterium]|nr:hypothetical protein [Candidatus Saccharimonadales bacterium]HSX35807.1 hypothetical protein [Patescibacteria group bacterium]
MATPTLIRPATSVDADASTSKDRLYDVFNNPFGSIAGEPQFHGGLDALDLESGLDGAERMHRFAVACGGVAVSATQEVLKRPAVLQTIFEHRLHAFWSKGDLQLGGDPTKDEITDAVRAISTPEELEESVIRRAQRLGENGASRIMVIMRGAALYADYNGMSFVQEGRLFDVLRRSYHLASPIAVLHDDRESGGRTGDPYTNIGLLHKICSGRRGVRELTNGNDMRNVMAPLDDPDNQPIIVQPGRFRMKTYARPGIDTETNQGMMVEIDLPRGEEQIIFRRLPKHTVTISTPQRGCPVQTQGSMQALWVRAANAYELAAATSGL